MSLSNKTIIITGSSRGIGREIALKCAADGANIVIASKSAEPHPKLAGTIHTVAAEVEAAGGKALPIQLDVRKELDVKKMMEHVAETFGGIDAVINNAGFIGLTPLEHTSPKHYDLMHAINARAVFVTAHYAIPYLKQSANPHILSLSPPLNFSPKWMKAHIPYTTTKYGMTLFTMGLAEELRDSNIAVNALWPRTIISTAAIEFAVGNKEMLKNCRTPAIMADAAYEILTTQSNDLTGQSLIDEELLRSRGTEDFSKYANDPEAPIHNDLFVD
ncbi:NAD(P)-dependent oxidoreductase [Pleionea sp. CnH1-48]|uniref:SDR family oxidoreductase n=1 Tax=Pleionea sp. CnH1-48 TaxID=2954494 RepID=UPI002096E72D|nr:NAD(P)-dependent oxidoreductase [Pleionea sp. CnH1-48]MCO7227224.1 NAD(P)-dependent oxidoreductase [Pleionea sp. CnH1-48]